MNVYRREGGGMSDHLLVEARLKVVCGWTSAGRMEALRNVLKVSKLNKSVKEHCTGNIAWKRWDVESVETEWEIFGDIVKECG